MDYRKFLGKSETLVLPHFGGRFVEARGRKLRLEAPLDEGWWQFEIKGRNATPIGRAETESSALENLPIVRGHSLGDRLVIHGAVAEPIFFLPGDEPARFSPLVGRRWPRGQLIFGSVEFESDAEDIARRALEDRISLSDAKGIPATLRAAFGYAVAFEVARHLRIPVAHAEVAGIAVEAAGENGRGLAENFIRAIGREREAADIAGRARRVAEDRARRALDAEERAETALSAAGAELLDSRNLEGNLLEVTYRFLNERFLTIVDRENLRVVDAGICLAGYDDRVTLESLPAVIRQAIAERRLVITRRAANDTRGRYHWERGHTPDPGE